MVNVNIKFRIDEATLECAIKSLLLAGEKPTKNKIVRLIKDSVYNRGISMIYFPEFWGDDVNDFDDDNLIFFIEKYRNLITL